MKARILALLLTAPALSVAAQTTQLVDLTFQTWRFQANGIDPGPNWFSTNYDDSAWSSGLGVLGYENNPIVAGLIHTSLPLSGAGGPIATFYFRTHFSYDGSVTNPFLMISNVVDDGAIFYLNGQEFGRVLMAGGPVSNSDLAITGSEEGLFTILERRATNLVVGDNLLAVEVHQQALSSSDLVFGAAVFVEPETATTNAGTTDYGFDLPLNRFVRTSVLLTNGQFLVGGGFSLAGSNRTSGGVAKIDRHGNLVPGFNGGTNISTSTTLNFDVYALDVANGQIYVGGSFNGSQRTNIARLNWDGSLDTNFVPAVPNNRVRAVASQPDGKVIIAGEFTAVGGVPRGYIARLLPDGRLDTSFATNAGANSRIRAVSLLDDGGMLIGGLFSSYNLAFQNAIVRLDAMGERVATFTASANAEVYCLTKAGNGHYVGGDFTSFNGITAPRIVRIDADGNVDTNFNVGTGLGGGPVYCMTEQYDGRIIVGGAFTTANGSAANAYLTRYLASGSHDGTFTVSAPANGLVLTTALAPGGELLVGGDFVYQFNRRPSRFLTLVRGDGPPRVSVQGTAVQTTLSWPGQATTFTLQESAGIGLPWTNSALPPVKIHQNFIVTNPAPAGTTLYRLMSP